MPDIDGIEAARQIRSLGLDSPPMLLMVTAYGRDEMLKEAARCGIDNVLVKPVSPSLLFDATMGVLSGRETASACVPGATADPRLETIRGRRVLLVEDNDVNQQVGRELLEHAGLIVEVAENGEVALAKAGTGKFDLVFMDMQMPVMDGIAATRAIRRIPRLAHLPVVAMTANAMETDRRRCIEAGMNDFLVKPIDPQEMMALLLRWIRPAAVSPAKPAAAAAALPGEVPQGIAGLDTTLGLSRMAGKKPLYLAMLRRYAAGQGPVAQQVRTALDDGDRTTAERLAHTLKGVSGSVGATEIQDRAGSLEQAIKDNEPAEEVRLRLVELEMPLGSLVAELQRQLPAPLEVAHA
jgi:two-component system sensor histidine kinase/response regulator